MAEKFSMKRLLVFDEAAVDLDAEPWSLGYVDEAFTFHYRRVFHYGKPVQIITYWRIVQNFEKWCMLPRGN